METKTKSGWQFDRKNSKGETIFKRFTGEPLDYVLEILDERGIEYWVCEKATMMFISANPDDYVYYWTTGRWNSSHHAAMRDLKHYRSNGIEDFLDRFFKPTRKERNNFGSYLTDEELEILNHEYNQSYDEKDNSNN